MTATTTVDTPWPAHIPAELVWNHKWQDFAHEGDDPFTAVTRIHDGPGMVWSPHAYFDQPGWIVTRYDLMSKVFQDHDHFTAERLGMIADLLGEPILLNPLEIDPPRHHQFRRVLNPFFAPSAIKILDDPVRRICRELIGGFKDKGGCEFINDFAIPFPSYVFLDLMDMPREMLDQFIEWQDRLMRATDRQDRVAAARAIYAYLKQHMEAQKLQPTNDFLAAMVNAQVDGEPIGHHELMGMFYVLYIGGLDTVYSTLGWILRHLALNPELQDRLRNDPALLPQAVEEFCRYYSIVLTRRQVRTDHVFEGVQMKAGEEVVLPVMLADRDPLAFDDPDTFDIDRKSRHIAFGTGAHNCIGVHLAKRELRIVLEEFLGAFRNIRMKPGETYQYHTVGTFGVDYLPIVWDR